MDLFERNHASPLAIEFLLAIRFLLEIFPGNQNFRKTAALWSNWFSNRISKRSIVAEASLAEITNRFGKAENLKLTNNEENLIQLLTLKSIGRF